MEDDKAALTEGKHPLLKALPHGFDIRKPVGMVEGDVSDNKAAKVIEKEMIPVLACLNDQCLKSLCICPVASNRKRAVDR